MLRSNQPQSRRHRALEQSPAKDKPAAAPIRVMTVFGTRPEVVKLAPVIHSLARRGRNVETVICSTGQHLEMLVPLCRLFGLTPHIELNVMKSNQTLGELTANLFFA